MSLQVWLPLNGSLENKGLGTLSSDFSISSPTYSAGKTGNNLKISSQQSNVVTINELTNKKNVTISFWFCPNSGNTFGQWRDVISFGVSNGTTVSSFRMEASSSTGKNFGWWGNGILTNDGGCCPYTLNLDTWYHITIVLNGTTIKKYINGELKETFTIPTSYANNYYFTGTMTLGDASMYISLADIRIYDECLSASRVSDVYDSLICYFDFNIPYKDQNLASRGSQYNFSGFNGTENQCPIFASIPIDVTRMVEGEKLTISFDATFSDFTVANGKSLACYFQSCLIKNGSVYWTTRLFETHGNFSKDVLAGGTFHYEWVQTIKSSVIEDLKSSTQCHLELRFDYAQSGKINITNTYVNYGDTIENNNYLGIDYIPESTGLIGRGVIHSSSKGLRYYYDSIMGENCLDLRGTDYTSAFQIKNFPQLKKSFTWNVWVKQEESDSQIPTVYQSILSYGRDWGGNTDTKSEMGMNISLNRGAPDIRYGHYDDENSSPNTNMQLLSSKKVNDGNWHMISTVMGDDGIMTLYIDGVKNMTASKSTYCSYSHASGGFIVGKMSYEYYSTSTYFPFNGMIDDVKVYATALSEDKIKKLYNVKSRIDKNGNVYCNQFIESSDMGNLLDDYQYPVNSATHSGVFSKVLVDCQDSITGKATKMTCNTAGLGFYIGGCWNTARSKFVNGKQYIWSMYVKSDNRTSITFNVECSSKQSKNTFVIDTNYRRIESVFTYSNSTAYSAFTCYSNFKVNENLYIHTFSVDEYNPKTNVDKKGILHTNSLIEIKSEEKCKIYKQDIQSNEIIEI